MSTRPDVPKLVSYIHGLSPRARRSAGNDLSASSHFVSGRIEVGRSVRIVYVDGLTAYVEPVVPIPEVAPAPGRPATSHMAHKES